MCNILKMAYCRAKGTKIWDSHSCITAYGGRISCFFEFSLGSLSALCKISDVKIFKSLLLPQFSFSFNQTLL